VQRQSLCADYSHRLPSTFGMHRISRSGQTDMYGMRTAVATRTHGRGTRRAG
jgi:hypothetical protein